MTLRFQPLRANRPEDVANVRRVIEGAPAYSLMVKGRSPSPMDAEDVFYELPPGKSAADKLVGGFWFNKEMVGCIEICKGYPEAWIAYIGLLLFSEGSQGRGLGRQALIHARALACSWRCRALRVAVIKQNERAWKFWKREGFCELYRKAAPGYTDEAIVMESELQPFDLEEPTVEG